MRDEGFNAYNKYRVIKHALKEKNVSQTCKLFGISRTSYYKWLRAYEKKGMTGLEIKEPQKPKMPNKISPLLESKILAYVEKYPADGPKRISYELKAEGFSIGESGIYNVLKRHHLERQSMRREYARKKNQSAKIPPPIKKNLPNYNDPSIAYPGFLIIQRIDYMGTFDGIGRIYQYSLYDTFSQWGFAKLYNRKQDIDVWYFFELKLVYLMRTLNLTIDNLITEKTKPYLSYFVNNDKYKETIEKFNIHHQFIESNHEELVEVMGGFNELLVKEFYHKIREDKTLDSFLKVEREMQKFLRRYNFSRKITNGCNKGKVPASVILEKAVENNVDLDTLPLWLLALLNPPQRGEKNE